MLKLIKLIKLVFLLFICSLMAPFPSLQSEEEPSYFVNAEVNCSSFLVENKANYYKYHCWLAFDEDPLTAWNEGTSGPGLKEWIEINFSKPILIDRLEILPGFFDSRWFKLNHRIKKCALYFDNYNLKASFEDKMQPGIVNLEQPIKTKTMTLWIEEVYLGTAYDEACISEIRFYYNNKKININSEAVIKKIKSLAGKDPWGSPEGYFYYYHENYTHIRKFFFPDGVFIKQSEGLEENYYQLLIGKWNYNPNTAKITVELSASYRADGVGEYLTLPLAFRIYKEFITSHKTIAQREVWDWKELIDLAESIIPSEDYTIELITPYHYDLYRTDYAQQLRGYIRLRQADYERLKDVDFFPYPDKVDQSRERH